MNWQEEYKLAIKDQSELNEFFDHQFESTKYPIYIPKTFAAKILHAGIHSPLGKQFLPHKDENNLELGLFDPIGDKIHSKENGIVHRYQNRALFFPTTVCPINCRYCFRKNELTNNDDIFKAKIDEAKNYLSNNPSIDEIILTGGDPLMLSNEKLATLIQEFSEVPNIKYFRIHSRMPIILPSRIDEGFINIITSARHLFKRSILMIHTNHEIEIDDQVEHAINHLIENQIELGSQTVLLKNVNDSTEDLKNLFIKLIDLNVRPYYLHHPDKTLGAMHFYLELEAGRKIYAPLRDIIPGWGLPSYVIDIPNGEGKIQAFNPENFEFQGHLLNRNGEKVKIN